MNAADRELENAIDLAAMRLSCADSKAKRRAAWEELCRLQKQRSAARVAEMEREQGLRR